MSASKESASENPTNSWVSPEKLALFQQRYEEGYDLPDKEYMDWLHEYHPDGVLDHTTTYKESSSNDYASQMGKCPSVTGSSSDHTLLVGTSSDHTSSLMDVLSSVPIATPVAIISDASSDVEHHSKVLSVLQQRESRLMLRG